MPLRIVRQTHLSRFGALHGSTKRLPDLIVSTGLLRLCCLEPVDMTRYFKESFAQNLMMDPLQPVSVGVDVEVLDDPGNRTQVVRESSDVHEPRNWKLLTTRYYLQTCVFQFGVRHWSSPSHFRLVAGQTGCEIPPRGRCFRLIVV
jgi:hypothetical protein